jgi:hypothetical protein
MNGTLREERLSQKKAIELDPNDATAHQWYSESLFMLGGREGEDCCSHARFSLHLDR